MLIHIQGLHYKTTIYAVTPNYFSLWKQNKVIRVLVYLGRSAREAIARAAGVLVSSRLAREGGAAVAITECLLGRAGFGGQEALGNKGSEAPNNISNILFYFYISTSHGTERPRVRLRILLFPYSTGTAFIGTKRSLYAIPEYNLSLR